MQLTVTGVIGLFLILIVAPLAEAGEGGENAIKQKRPMLTVAETIDLARFPRESYRLGYALENSLPVDKIMRGKFIDLVKRANPAAAGELYKVLKDVKQDAYWRGTVRVLGRIGGKEAIDKFESIIFSASNSPEVAGKRSLLISILAGTLVNMYVKENIPEAQKKLDEMLTYKYWHTRRKAIGLSTSTPKGRLQAEYHCIVTVLYSYVSVYLYLSDPGFPAKARSVLEQVKDSEQRKLLTKHIERTIELNHLAIKQKKEREERSKQKKKSERTPSEKAEEKTHKK